MAKEESAYNKDGKKYLRVRKYNKDSGETIWQKEIPKETKEGVHFIYGREDQFHYDVQLDEGGEKKEYLDVSVLGSACVVQGENIFNKSPDEEFHFMPIWDNPKNIRTEDNGNNVKIIVDKKGKIFYATTKKRK